MKIMAHLHPQHASYGQIREAAIRAEEMGFDGIYNACPHKESSDLAQDAG